MYTKMRKISKHSLTPTEYKILSAVPRARSYAEISRMAGISTSYVSRKIEELYGRGFRIRGIFDLEALGLSEVFLLAEYDDEIFSPPNGVQIPYILRKIKYWRGKTPLMAIYAAVPEGQEEEFSEALGLEGIFRRVVMTTRWRIDTARLTELRNGIPVSAYERLSEVYDSIEPYEPRANEKRVPDRVDTWLIAELMRNPYVKIASRLRYVGVKQQVASYHLSRHVERFIIYNTVRIKERARPPYRLLGINAAKGEERRLGRALAQAPAVYEAYVLEDGIIMALVEAYKWEEGDLYRLLRDSEYVEDFEEMGFVMEEPRAYSTPYGNVVTEKSWILDPLYASLYTIKRKTENVSRDYFVYELD